MVAILANLTRVIAGIPVPDSPIINATIAYAQENLLPPTFNHVMRSWLYGQAIINNLPAANLSMVDQEAHAVAAILHDLGFSNNTALLSQDKRFEVDGAMSARAFVQREDGKNWDQNRQRIVWDAIALHTIAGVAVYKELEVSLVAASSTIDFVGPEKAKGQYGDLVTVTQAQYDDIAKEFPTTGQKTLFIDQLVALCRNKPLTTYDNFVSDFGEKFVTNYSRVGYRALDIMEALPDDE